MNINDIEPRERSYVLLSRVAIFLYIVPMLLVAYRVISLPLWALYLLPVPYFLLIAFCYLRLGEVGRLHIRPVSIVLTLITHVAICFYVFGS
ncbi:hypothetical protein [Telluribacter sp. SYSU D00476]|uniref:hypothetical protein n=1 Tax=Telluribacter sp. SYSU D00476 TaxID=2811430 RepID=UPI001FF50840|nr:hypothetical protein [Telluribacter sp. SYSU D00476]